MKSLAIALLALAPTFGFAGQNNKLRLNSKDIESFLTVELGHVSPEELELRLVRLTGVKAERGQIIIDLKNPNQNITEIIDRNGRIIDLTRSIGGDMGGGGKI